VKLAANLAAPMVGDRTADLSLARSF